MSETTESSMHSGNISERKATTKQVPQTGNQESFTPTPGKTPEDYETEAKNRLAQAEQTIAGIEGASAEIVHEVGKGGVKVPKVNVVVPNEQADVLKKIQQ